MSTVMCKTTVEKWGYSITNPTTKTRVNVGPFLDRESANSAMNNAQGQRKVLKEMKKFHFTPEWNGLDHLAYKGEDIEFKKQYPL